MRKLLLITVLFSFITAFSQNKTSVPKKPTTSKPTTTKTPAANTNTKTGHHISIHYAPYKNTWLYIGSHYGSSKILVDSAWTDNNSNAIFKGDNKYTSGIYFLVSPQKTIEFEFLMDELQQFSISGDTTNRNKQTFSGSFDNDLFQKYSAFSAVKGKAMHDLEMQLPSAKTKADSTAIINESRKLGKEMKAYQDNIAKTYPNSLLAMLFNVMKRPETPAIPIVKGKPDSLYPYRFVKEHFWDDVNFYDDRNLRTPFFDKKVDEYFKYYISPEADSIKPEIGIMLNTAKNGGGKEIYPFLLTKFTNKYANPEYMGQDEVFLYLFDEYYNKGDTTILNEASKKTVIEKAYNLMGNRLGKPAAEMKLTDTLGNYQSLYNVKGKFTVVLFWDPHCGHCKEQIPRYDSIYKAKWKALDVKVYSVYIYNDNIPDWKKFITEKGFKDWVHVYQKQEDKEFEAKNNIPNFRQLYNAHLTPTVYLLDEQKRIIAKQLTLEQFDDIIARQLKNNSTK